MWKMGAIVVLCLFGAGLLQSVHGLSQSSNGFPAELLENGLQDLSEITDSLKQSILEMANTVGDVTSEKIQLNARLLRVDERCLSEDLKHHVTLLNMWDFDSCVNLTDALLESQQVFVEGVEEGWNIAGNMGNVIMDLLDCPSIYPFTAIKCYNKNFGLLKDTIIDNKNWVKKYFNSAKKSLSEIRYEFDMCFGIPPPSKQFIKAFLDGIPQDCVNKS